jgi:hypothetical protein
LKKAMEKTMAGAWRRRVLAGVAGMAGLWLASGAWLPAVDVYKSPYCGCCTAWAKHMREAGFSVAEHPVGDVDARRAQLGMPKAYGSCHTATAGGYLLEGHVPAADVQRLLREHPDAIGLAVPGMPPGSPGMEGPPPQAFDTLLIRHDGSAVPFAHHAPAR